MKLILFMMVFALCAEARIEEVTIYKDRASITRTQTEKVGPGATRIVFKGVTPLLDRDSLKASLSEKKAVRILGIRAETQIFETAQNPEVEKLKARERLLTNEKNRIEESIRLMSQEQTQLVGLSNYYKESFSFNLQRRRWTPENLVQFNRLLANEENKHFGKWKKAFKEYNRLLEDLQWTQAQIQKLSSVSDTRRTDVILDVESDAKTTVQASIQYLVGNVGWHPTYDLKISRSRKDAVIEQHALVWQQTGENWDEVKLRLSHSRNELHVDPPSLSPYHLSYRKVSEVKTNIVARKRESAQQAKGAEGDDEEEIKGLDRVFELPGKHSLAEGKNEVKFFVAKAVVPYREQLQLVASQYPHVYRRGTIKNPFNWRLNEGALNVFEDGTFVQSFNLEPVAKLAEFSLNAGVDYDVKATRTVEDQTEDASMLGSTKTLTRKVGIQLKNYSGSAKEVNILEQIPISEMESVKVAWKQLEGPARAIASKDEGIEGWINAPLTVKSRQEVKQVLEIKVEVPKDFGFSWN